MWDKDEANDRCESDDKAGDDETGEGSESKTEPTTSGVGGPGLPPLGAFKRASERR